jgi:hypothetical protein
MAVVAVGYFGVAGEESEWDLPIRQGASKEFARIVNE